MDVSAPTQKKHFTRRSFLKLAGVSALAMGAYAGEISRHEISIEEHPVHLDRLPEAFRGMHIVQISDIHYAEYTEAFFVRRIVEHVNRLRPDVVVLTGDFISYGPLPYSFARRHIWECAALLREIHCPQRYAVLGNHDCIVGPEYVIDALESNTIPVLMNTAVPLERQGQRLWFAGLGSACTKLAHPDVAIPKAAVSGNEPVIVLAHEPDILPEVAKYNADLMLSGHTHGGQVRIPLLPPLQLPPLGKNYVEGFFRVGRTQLYVNRGIGAVGLPFRLFCPPEITSFTLV
ncbi:metallophosphoesterase [Paracidobacterium acidisoli]|uniref:Metallophosphoesterase n=1 Tax=Paracidobacterium acidisoli TaxID=2303751 RepID=A0A372IK22_9BACT|nr:metallophosphoesterase [Paracidobacterium acidisoli]MBT9333152.1 metallophosphoesterase [Paracidobacterium acidisoli]